MVIPCRDVAYPASAFPVAVATLVTLLSGVGWLLDWRSLMSLDELYIRKVREE